MFRKLLAAWDPYIASLRKPPQKKLKSLLPDAVDLLLHPHTHTDEDAVDVDAEDDSDEHDLIWDSDEDFDGGSFLIEDEGTAMETERRGRRKDLERLNVLFSFVWIFPILNVIFFNFNLFVMTCHFNAIINVYHIYKLFTLVLVKRS